MTKTELSQLEIDKKIFELKRQKFEALQAEQKFKKGLPHLHGFKFYPWGRTVYDSLRDEVLLCSANQVGKSTVAIRRNIYWATAPELWPKLWPKLDYSFQKPNLFWYFYPSFPLATTEFETKWEPLLPQGEFKDDPVYGWRAYYDKGEIREICFNSGVTIQFKAYSQKVSDLQASSVYSITCDEELPVEFLAELSMRTNATNGYFLMVFTATLGQLHWKEAMEPSSDDTETHKNALKIQVSLYDSQTYEDGTPSPWTNEKITRIIAKCATPADVQRRVYGRFVKSEGLLYESFSIEHNMSAPHHLPRDWHVYGGVDPGAGGTGHPAAIVFVAVNPQYTKGRVFKGWRGDGILTSSDDILTKWRELREEMVMALQIYDYQAKDFFVVATSKGETFIPADKSRDAGTSLLNTLWKTQMLKIQTGDPELGKLVTELITLNKNIDKRKAKDDLIDALRYTVKLIPWDFSNIEIPGEIPKVVAPPKEKTSGQVRRDYYLNGNAEKVDDSIAAELEYYSDLQGTFD